jgi:hypothetical protein
MKATIWAVAGRDPREESRGRLQDFIGPAQLEVLSFQLLHPGPLVGAQPGPLAGIGLGPPHPPSKRLVVDRQLRSDLLDGFPLRGALALVIEDHLHGAFSGLRRIWTSCAIPPPVASAVG